MATFKLKEIEMGGGVRENRRVREVVNDQAIGLNKADAIVALRAQQAALQAQIDALDIDIAAVDSIAAEPEMG